MLLPMSCCRDWPMWSAVSLLLLLLAPLAAQRPTARAIGSLAVATSARSLEGTDGVARASGPHYRASLTSDGLRLVPALGRRSPRVRELHFEMLSSGRVAGPATPAGRVAPTLGDHEVRYDRQGVVESYAVLAGGLEQSFVFAELPAGAGDLVVRGRVTTDLPMTLDDDGGLRFVDPMVGGITIGAVVGIDADGRRVPGTMHCAPEAPGTWAIELALPATFVATARFPLVLDPFLAPALTPGAGPDDEYPDVAYESTHDTWLFIWDRSFSITSTDLVGQRYSGAGAPIGGLITIASNVMGMSRNRVATVEARDTFVATWWQASPQTNVFVASVHAATGAVNGPLQLTTSGADDQPDIGVATAQDDAAIVVWLSAAGVRGTRVTVASTGALAAGPILPLSPVGSGGFPVLSRRGGSSGRLLVTWCQQAQQQVHGAVFDPNLQVLATGMLFANPALPNNVYHDGDGTQWITAWHQNGNVYCRQIVFDPTTNTLSAGPQVPIATQANLIEAMACVAWLDGVAAIGYVARANLGTASQTTTTLVTTVDGYSCTQCAPAVVATVRPAGWFAANPRLGARPAGNGIAAEAMLTFFEGTGTATVVAHRFRSDDGLEWDRGGGCGGGVATHGCAVLGNAGYSLRLDAAPAAAPVFLVLGAAMGNFACGPCMLVPDAATGATLFLGATSGSGGASYTLPIPASPPLAGFHFFSQWLTSSAGGCLGFTASNALEIQLQ